MNPEQQFGLLRRWEVALAASRDQRVPRAALAVLMAILDRLSNERGDAWPSLSRIAADTGSSRSSVVRAINTLVALTYLHRESGDRARANIYRIGTQSIRGSVIDEPRIMGAPRAIDEPRCADDTEGRCTDEPQLGAPVSLQPTHRTYPIEPTQQRAHSRAVEGAFDQFWDAYPRKVAKGAARKAFAKLEPGPDLLTQLLDAIATQRVSEQWLKDRGQYIPNPATWLNQERWSDQLTEARVARPEVIAGESLADRSARMHADQARSGRVIDAEFRAVAARLPRETNAAAINDAAMRRLGLKE